MPHSLTTTPQGTPHNLKSIVIIIIVFTFQSLVMPSNRGYKGEAGEEKVPVSQAFPCFHAYNLFLSNPLLNQFLTEKLWCYNWHHTPNSPTLHTPLFLCLSLSLLSWVELLCFPLNTLCLAGKYWKQLVKHFLPKGINLEMRALGE